MQAPPIVRLVSKMKPTAGAPAGLALPAGGRGRAPAGPPADAYGGKPSNRWSAYECASPMTNEIVSLRRSGRWK